MQSNNQVKPNSNSVVIEVVVWVEGNIFLTLRAISSLCMLLLFSDRVVTLGTRPRKPSEVSL